MAAKAGPIEVEATWPDPDNNEIAWLAGQQTHLRTILSRAVVVYLALFIGLGLLMLALGINPLVNNGLMPKVLLVFVGLALAIALANTLTETDLLREQARNWLRLVPRWECAATDEKLDE